MRLRSPLFNLESHIPGESPLGQVLQGSRGTGLRTAINLGNSSILGNIMAQHGATGKEGKEDCRGDC